MEKAKAELTSVQEILGRLQNVLPSLTDQAAIDLKRDEIEAVKD